MYSFKYNQQDATLIIFFIIVTAVHVSGGFRASSGAQNLIQYSLSLSMLYMFQAVSPPIIRSSKTVHTASGICQAWLVLPLAVAASVYSSVYSF